MDDTNQAMLIASFTLTNSIVTKLYQSGKITAREAEDIYDFALLNLEHQQALFAERGHAVEIARALLDGAIQAIRTAPDYDEE